MLSESTMPGFGPMGSEQWHARHPRAWSSEQSGLVRQRGLSSQFAAVEPEELPAGAPRARVAQAVRTSERAMSARMAIV